jgi:hypothetical protein
MASEAARRAVADPAPPAPEAMALPLRPATLTPAIMSDMTTEQKAELLRWAVELSQKFYESTQAVSGMVRTRLEALQRRPEVTEMDSDTPLGSVLADAAEGCLTVMEAFTEQQKALVALVNHLAEDPATVEAYRELTGEDLPEELPGVM